MFTEILTVAPGQAAAGVKVIDGSNGANTGETPANATRTMSNTIEIVFKPANHYHLTLYNPPSGNYNTLPRLAAMPPAQNSVNLVLIEASRAMKCVFV
jgi:hypothetical protein